MRELLESTPYEVLAILEGATGIYPREPRSQVLAVSVGEVSELLGVSFLKKAQLRVLCELVAEHLVCSLAASHLLHPTIFTQVRGRGILGTLRLAVVGGIMLVVQRLTC